MIFHYVSPSGTWYEHNKFELIKGKMTTGEFFNQDYECYFIMRVKSQLNSDSPFTFHIDQYKHIITYNF